MKIIRNFVTMGNDIEYVPLTLSYFSYADVEMQHYGN